MKAITLHVANRIIESALDRGRELNLKPLSVAVLDAGGHLIAFQIEEQVKKTGKIGPEIERMAKFGALTPDAWMTNATGEPVSAGPLLRATEAALKK